MTEFNSKIKQNSRILKIFLFSICALFACAINAHAQSLVQGTVTDETGESLPGVSVVVKGTTNGTVTDVYENLHAAGVVDPAKVTRVALENAASIAGMFLTTECVIVEKKEDKPEMPMGAPGMGGMGGMM